VVSVAVQKYGDSLRWASEGLRANKSLVLKAVKNDGLALQHAPDLISDPDVVMASKEKQ